LAKKYKSFNDIYVHHFDTILRIVGGNMAKNPYNVGPVAKKTSDTKQGAAAGVQNLEAGGLSDARLYVALKTAGMDVGVCVNVLKHFAVEGGETKFVIVSIDEPAKGSQAHATIAHATDKRKIPL
jgi:hypothetical protein